LSAGILHQISQPITAIHGFVRFMKKEMNPQDVFYKPVCLMEEQTVYLKEMLENLMMLIRHRKITKSNVDVNAVIERSLSLMADELRIRRVNWETAQDLRGSAAFAADFYEYRGQRH
jgi:signal transduction histidine kinase